MTGNLDEPIAESSAHEMNYSLADISTLDSGATVVVIEGPLIDSPGPSNALDIGIGDTVEDSFVAISGIVVNINGGSVGNFFNANSGSETNINSGMIGGFFSAAADSRINIRGGSGFVFLPLKIKVK